MFDATNKEIVQMLVCKNIGAWSAYHYIPIYESTHRITITQIPPTKIDVYITPLSAVSEVCQQCCFQRAID